jgi:hypothetical protein
MTDSSSGETLLHRTNREFNEALGTLSASTGKRDYSEAYLKALNVIRWIHDANFGDGSLDQVNDTHVSQAVLTKTLPRETVGAELRNIVFCGEVAPPALLLYAADILDGNNLGRSKRKTKAIIDEVTLITRIGELYDQNSSMKEAYDQAAKEGFGNGNPDTVKREYASAKRRRSSSK